MSEFKDDLSSEAEVRSVTQAQLEEQVKREFFFTGRDGVYRSDLAGDAAEALSHVTICVLILHNGLKLVGVNTGSVDPRNFNPQMAMTMARKAAIDQLWPMLGYQLKEQMYQDRLMEEWSANTVLEVGMQSEDRSLEDAMKQLDRDVQEITGMPVDRDANLNAQTERKMEQKWPSPPLEIDEGVKVHNKNPPL